MIKYLNIFSLIIILLSITGLFQVKYHVQNLNKDYLELVKHVNQEKEAIHVLKAEWTYLNQPERLKSIIAKHLNLAVVKVTQIHKLDNNLPQLLAEIEPNKTEMIINKQQDKFADDFARDIMNPKVLNVSNKSKKNKSTITQVKY